MDLLGVRLNYLKRDGEHGVNQIFRCLDRKQERLIFQP